MQGKQVCLVTGGRGFLARHLVLRLLDEGKWVVRIADLSAKLTLSPDELDGPLDRALRAGTAQYMPADVRNKEQVLRCCTDAAAVFHLAAPNSSLEDRALHLSVTVEGTRNVIDACRACGVRKLVYTSSPCVVMDGCAPLVDADESLPFARTFNDVYSEMKAKAEAMVLQANDRNGEGGGLRTCAIRPFGIYGPGDQLALPTFIAGARSWQMKFVLGDGRNLFDWTYVENVAHAHVCAERALGEEEEEEEVSGQAYFITDGRPQRFWDFVGDFLSALGYPRPRLNLPTFLLLPASHVAAWFSRKTGIGAGHHFTPSRVRLVTNTCTFDISRARQRLGYHPPVPRAEAMRRTVAGFAHQRAPKGTTVWSPGACVKTALASSFKAASNLSASLILHQKQLLYILLFAFCTGTGLELCAVQHISAPLIS